VLAAVVEAYGPPEVVHVREVPDPVLRPRDVLVRVRATAVTIADARIRGARFPAGFAVPARLALGIRRPRRPILGTCVSGVVAAVGAEVSEVAPGDEVTAMTGGAHAELVAVAADRLVAKPASVSHDDAAGVLFGGTTARYFLQEKASVSAGDRVLVNGASGAVGTNVVQLARHLGAQVTGVTSTANAALVADLGAAAVIDHTTQDVLATEQRFDVVVDAVGNLPVAALRGLLRPSGTLLLVVASLGATVRARGQVVTGTPRVRPEHIRELLQLVADGHLRVVQDRSYGLDEVRRAHEHVDSGRKVGNVLLHP